VVARWIVKNFAEFCEDYLSFERSSKGGGQLGIGAI